jgi:hypothetical protein
VTPLTPHQVEQLVSLRLGLEDALRRAKQASKYRRGAAIVALDAAVERASSIVSITRGLPIPTNGKLDDLISRLVQDLGPLWKPTVLPDIRHLRRARNASQHEGLEPDREQVPLWASATEAYVSTLIEAQFEVDIRRVVLSDAILDNELREEIRQAEVALASNRYRSCVDHAANAYEEALSRWKRLRGRHRHRFSPTSREILDGKSYEYLSGQLSDVQSVLDTVAFSDAADAEWFTLAIEEQGDVLNMEDAERVLAFAYEWIVEYERAAESWTPNRRQRAASAARMVRAEDVPARIHSCLSVDIQNGFIRAVFRIADLPAEDEYSQWVRTVQDILPAYQENLWWDVLDDGTIVANKKAAGSGDFSADVEVLAAALQEGHAALAEKQRLVVQRAEDINRQKAEYAGSIDGIQNRLPEWVEEIEWTPGEFGEHLEQLSIRVTDEVSSLRFGESIQNGHFDRRQSLMDVIRNHELIDQCYGMRGRNMLGVIPVLGAEQLLAVLLASDMKVREQLEIDASAQDLQVRALVTSKATIAAKLAELS